MFSKKPLSVEEIFQMLLTSIKGGTIQLTYGDAYYRQLVLALGPLELAHYRPLLSDFQAALKERLGTWYTEHGVDYRPALVLTRDHDHSHASGAFEENNIPDSLTL